MHKKPYTRPKLIILDVNTGTQVKDVAVMEQHVNGSMMTMYTNGTTMIMTSDPSTFS